MFSQPFVDSPAASSLDKCRMVCHFPEPGFFSKRPRGEVWKCLLKIIFAWVMENGPDIHLVASSEAILSSMTCGRESVEGRFFGMKVM